MAKQNGVDYIKGELFVFVLIILMFMGIAAAANQPYNIEVTKSMVKATSKCSCGSGSWKYHTATFQNYCPMCGSHGTLHYWKKCDAGQWTCSHCDCDYCMACGKEKILGSDVYLKRYVKHEVKIVEAAPAPQNIDRMQQIKQYIKNKWGEYAWINQ